MADKKISELTALAVPANNDLLAIVDTSATETKYIQKQNIFLSSDGTAGSAGEAITILAGDGNAAGSGGEIDIYSGDGGATGNGADLLLRSGSNGAGGSRGGNVTIRASGTSGATQGDVIIQGSVSSTTMDHGFLVIPAIAGAPTGTPTEAGSMVFDKTNFKLYLWSGAAWKSVTLS